MKLRGKWVTVNSITRFVRDPDPIAPHAPRKKVAGEVLRSHDYEALQENKRRKQRRERIRCAEPWDDDWSELVDYSRSPKKFNPVMRAHRLLLSRREAGDYDRPVLSSYALGLLARRESVGDLAVNPLPWGCRMKGFTTLREDSSFTSFYLFGSAMAAGNPRRPCDHSGIH